MTHIYNRRDFGYTIISRFEETFRQFLINKLSSKYDDARSGIPPSIVTRTDEKSPIFFWSEINDFFENLDFPDLLEISIYKDNFEDFYPITISKNDLTIRMSNLYGLRCKIAHVKGYFTSFDLDKLVELTSDLSVYIDTSFTFRNLLEIIQNHLSR